MKLKTIQTLVPIALVLASSSMASAQTAASKADEYRVDIRLTQNEKKPANAPAGTPWAKTLQRVKKTIKFVAHDGATLSLSAKTPGSRQLNVATGGRSQCVRLYAHQAGRTPIPLQFSFIKRGSKDPCTGKAPVGGFATEKPTVSGYWLHYWKVQCRDGKCGWIKVHSHHNTGW